MSKKKKISFDKSTKQLVVRLWREAISPYRWHLLLALYFMIITAAGEAMTLKMLQPVVDKVFVEKNPDMLWPIAGAVLFVFIIKSFAAYGQAGLMSMIGLRVVADIQINLFKHLSRMDNRFFQSNTTGSLVSRFSVDTIMMRNAVSTALTGIGKDAMSVIFLVMLMFHQDAMLASIVLFIFPIAFYPVVFLGRRMRKVTANTQEEMGVLVTILEQTFHGISVVKAYGMELYEQSRVSRIVNTVFSLSYKAGKTRAMSRPLMELLGGVAICVVIVYGGHRVIEGVTSPGSFFSFIAAVLTAYRPMKALANLNVNLQEGLAGAQRVFQVLDTEPAIKDKPSAKILETVSGSIEFDNVIFSYEGKMNALNGLSLEVPAGETVAIVGSSGAGKSTILNLIPRFYDTTSGSVKIDGQNVQDVTLESLRDSMALVSQEVTLFDDTIRENIAYGRTGATDEEIINAAKHAAAHDFITALPDGYDTAVGERGLKLSGGQRQRLAIARAMLKDAPILLLDEATSALDTESERKVQKALDELMKDRTTIVIAHRLSTIVNANIIHVVENGELIESGTHDELIERKKAYAYLYELQFNKNK